MISSVDKFEGKFETYNSLSLFSIGVSEIGKFSFGAFGLSNSGTSKKIKNNFSFIK